MLHNQQQHSTSLSQLRQFLTQISSQPDPYWQTILQSDIRNIIPKHEVCKIQLVKNSLSKTRLIMENLNTFISLQVQKKHLKEDMIDLNQNINTELEAIVNEHNSFAEDTRFHYDTRINKRKKQLQVIAKELARSKTSNELKILIQKNIKWQQYIEKHVKELEKTQEADIHADIANFIKTYEQLFLLEINPQGNPLYAPSKETIDEIVLNSGNYTNIYQNKIQEKILISKLLDDIYGTTEETTQATEQDEYWRQQILKIRKIHDI